MAQLNRFGRRLALPSTRQIRHELLLVVQEDERRKALKAGAPDGAATAPDVDPPVSPL